MTEQIVFQPKKREEKTQDAVVSKEKLEDFLISTLGNVDAGKSTLVSCLVRQVVDDGRGKARSYVLKHSHELKRGQSSTVALSLMGFSNDKQVIPSSVTPEAARKQHTKDFFDVASKSDVRVTFVDLCGHEKYLKTTIYGLTGFNPHAAMVVIGADRGIQKLTREHVGLCCALQIPFFIVITKIDMAPPEKLKEVQMKVKKILKRTGRKAFYVTHPTDIAGAVKVMQTGQAAFAPVLETSCVTGHNIENLRGFIKLLATKRIPRVRDLLHVDNKENQSTCSSCLYLVDDVFNVPGVGIVLGGMTLKGSISNQQKLYVGPDSTGGYRAVTVRSIYRNCVPSETCFPGQHATLAIKTFGRGTLKRDMFRKGMVVCGEADYEQVKKSTVYEFEADVKVLHHSTTIDSGYSPHLHLAGTRQSARILQLRSHSGEEDVLARTGSQVLARFRFLHQPEHIQVGTPLIFREGTAKGCGRVTKLFDKDGNEVII